MTQDGFDSLVRRLTIMQKAGKLFGVIISAATTEEGPLVPYTNLWIHEDPPEPTICCLITALELTKLDLLQQMNIEEVGPLKPKVVP